MKINKLILYVVLFLVIPVSTNAIDDLTKFKLKLMKQFKPQKNWSQLYRDTSFKLNYDDVNSFMKMPTCLHVFEDKLLIVDNQSDKVNAYSKNDGSFLNSFGRLGRGPGDLASPFWLETFKNKIYLKSNNGLDIFDKNGKFENRIRLFMTVSHFSVIDDHIYFGFRGAYKTKYPLFLKMALNGMVKAAVFNEDINNPFTQRAKRLLFLLPANERLIAIPMHWNKVYIYDKNNKLIKKKKIDYPLLDKIEEWNGKRAENKRMKNFYWPCNIILNIRALDNKIFIFLNLPSRVEILVLNSDGNIERHLFNTDFPLMRWKGFDVQKNQQGQTVFYIIGYAISDGDDGMMDFNVYRLVDKNSKHIER